MYFLFLIFNFLLRLLIKLICVAIIVARSFLQPLFPMVFYLISSSLEVIVLHLNSNLIFLVRAVKRHHNIAIEVNDQGEILRVMHDTQGKLTYALSQVTELSDGRLVLGSYLAEFVSFVEI